MDIRPLTFRSSLKEYQKQAEQLFKACKSVDPETLHWIEERPHLVKKIHGTQSGLAAGPEGRSTDR